MYDAAAGVARGSWTAQVYAENLTNTNAILAANYVLYVKSDTIARPRTISLRLSYSFGGH
jgi:outer membrane receptor protein involved in Fe transport